MAAYLEIEKVIGREILNSSASNSPVDAPEGAAPLPTVPSAR